MVDSSGPSDILLIRFATHALRRWTRALFRLELALCFSFLVVVAQLIWPAVVSWWHSPGTADHITGSFEARAADGHQRRLDYWIYLPKDYAREAGKSW
jgi:hypothetical protein